MSDKFILIGAGAQGRVSLDILEDSGYEVTGFLDDNETVQGKEINGKKVIGTTDCVHHLVKKNYRFIITVGNNYIRELIFKKLQLELSSYGNIIHKSSVILKSSSTGYGNMIFANTFIGSNSRVGNHAVINNGCIVEHDCTVGDFSSLSPGCRMGGRVSIGRGSFISTGVTLSSRVKIGENAIIGAGSVVVEDIPSGVLAYGVPARIIRKISREEMWERLL